MLKFTVTGADAESGESRSMEVIAADADGASRAAAEAGMLVHRVYPTSGRSQRAATAGLAKAKAWMSGLDGTTRAGLWAVVSVVAFACLVTLVTTALPPQTQAKHGAGRQPPAADETYTAERERRADPIPEPQPVPRWWQPTNGDSVDRDVVYLWHIAAPKLRPTNTQVGVVVTFRNDGREDRRVELRVKAVDRDFRVIHYDRWTMQAVGVIDAGAGDVGVVLSYSLPAEVEDDYAGTIVEVLSVR